MMDILIKLLKKRIVKVPLIFGNSPIVDARRWPGYSDAVMHSAQANVEALLAGEELPGGEGVADPSCLAMTTESLTREYPLYTPSLLNLVKTSETRARELTGEDRT